MSKVIGRVMLSAKTRGVLLLDGAGRGAGGCWLWKSAASVGG